MQQCQDRGGPGDFQSLSLETRRLRLTNALLDLSKVSLSVVTNTGLPFIKVFSQVELC